MLIGVAMAAQLLATKIGHVDMPDRMGSLGWGMVHFIAGGVAFFFVLIKWLKNTDFTAYGLFVGLISTGALAYGGFTVAKERGDFPATSGRGGPSY